MQLPYYCFIMLFLYMSDKTMTALALSYPLRPVTSMIWLICCIQSMVHKMVSYPNNAFP